MSEWNECNILAAFECQSVVDKWSITGRSWGNELWLFEQTFSGDHLALHYGEQVVDENVLGEILWGFSDVKCFEDLVVEDLI